MITVILGIGFTAVSIAAFLQVKKNKDLERRLEYNTLLGEKHHDMVKESFEITKVIIEGVYYHPETDTLIPFEDLEYIGEF